MWKLFLRHYLQLIVSAVIAILGVNHLAGRYVEPYVNESNRETARGQFYLVERELQRHPIEQWPARFAELQAHFGPELGLMRLSTRQRIPLPVSSPPRFPEAPAALTEDDWTRIANGNIFVRLDDGLFAHRIGDSDYVATARDPGADFGLIGLYANLAVSLFIGAILYLRVRAQWKDLEKLNAAADRLGEGALTTRLSLSKRSDIARVGERFNAMAARLEQLVNAHTTLTHAVAHELRTPIARLRFGLDKLAGTIPEAERHRQLARCNEDLDQLQTLVEESLSFARLERGNLPGPTEHYALHDWLAAAVADTQLEAEGLGLECRVALPPPGLKAVLSPMHATRAVDNLCRNALRHARHQVSISLQWSPSVCTLSVEDDGPGVPAAERARILDPFVRLDESRERGNHPHAGGFGLGLAIVRLIAEWHGGKLQVNDSALGGARFTLSWPTHGKGNSSRSG